jgi:hypothetical protein
VNVHERVAVPGLVTLAGETVHAALSAARLTTPVKPFIDATVMVEVPTVPAFAVKLVGLAVTVKSWVL